MSEPQQPSAQPYGTPPHYPSPPQPYAPPQHQTPVQYQGQPQQQTPVQYPGQPQHQGQPQSAPPQYQGQAFAAPDRPAASAAGSGLGRLAFILALVALGIGLLVTFAFPLIIRSLSDPTAIGLFSAVGNGLVLIVSIAALIVGLMSMRRPRQQIPAGIAIGISASAIAGIVMSWLSNLAYALPY